MNEDNNNQVEIETEYVDETQKIYYAPPYQQEYYSGQNNSTGWGVAALVMGISSILLSCCCACFNLPFAILGLIFGIIAVVKKSGKGMGIAGIITSAVSLIIAILFIVFFAFVGSTDYTSYMNDLENNLYTDFETAEPDDYNDKMENYFNEFFNQLEGEEA